MTLKYALDFLRKHQPMPNDDDLTEELIDIYDNIREFFLVNEDVRCVPLFLNSFGYISGLGVYQLVESVILNYNNDEVVPHLIKSMASKYYSVRYWSVQIAFNFKDLRLIDGLIGNLNDTSSCSDIRYFAFGALFQYKNNKKIQNYLKEVYNKETDLEIKESFKDILEENL